METETHVDGGTRGLERAHEPAEVEIKPPRLTAHSNSDQIARRRVVCEITSVAWDPGLVVRACVRVELQSAVHLQERKLAPVLRENLQVQTSPKNHSISPIPINYKASNQRLGLISAFEEEEEEEERRRRFLPGTAPPRKSYASRTSC